MTEHDRISAFLSRLSFLLIRIAVTGFRLQFPSKRHKKYARSYFVFGSAYLALSLLGPIDASENHHFVKSSPCS